MQLKYSEVCLITGTWMTISGNSVFGYVLIGASAVLALCRLSLDINQKRLKDEKIEENTKVIIDTISNTILGSGLFSGKSTNKKSVLH
jgi:hypothetical protein